MWQDYVIYWFDWPLSLFLIIFVLKWADRFVEKNKDNILVQLYFKKAITLKLFGAVCFCLYHYYMYGGGDTFGYFLDGKQICASFLDNPSNYFKLIFLPVKDTRDILEKFVFIWYDYVMWMNESNFFQIRLSAIIQVFTFQTFIPTTIIFSLLSFIGIWKCFIIYNKLFSNSDKVLAISFLFFPTLIFWGSGLGKDSICLGSVCGIAVASYSIFVFKKKLVKNSIALVLLTLVVLIVKPYIAITFLPTLFLALGLKNVFSIKNIFLRMLALLLLLAISVPIAAYAINSIANNFNEYAFDNLADKLANSNLSLQSGANSAFDLGIKPENINSLNDILAFFPKAIVATFYRPWIWEAKNIAMLAAALESFFCLGLCVLVLFKSYLLKLFSIILKEPILLSSLLYCIFFGGFIGLSTSNFGTLVRYKLPCVPFFISAFLLINKRLSSKTNVLK